MLALSLHLRTLLAALDPALPWIIITALSFLSILATRKWMPKLWLAFDKITPDGALGHVLQGMPAVMLGAIYTTFLSGGDFGEAWKGACWGALAPVLHLAAKNYRGSVAVQVAAKIAGVALVLVVCSGCHGTFDQVHHPNQQRVGAKPELSARCKSLSNIHRDWGGIAEGAAVGAGASGIAIIPTVNRDVEAAEAGGTVALAITAAIAGFISRDAAVSYVQECE